jgi:hypothetical protein
VLTVSVTTPNGEPGAAGFNLRASKPGRFALGGPDSDATRIVVGIHGWQEATHSRPKSGEPARFSVVWTPDASVAGLVRLTAWGNAVDNNGKSGPAGDLAATSSVDVWVGAAGSGSRRETPAFSRALAAPLATPPKVISNGNHVPARLRHLIADSIRGQPMRLMVDGSCGYAAHDESPWLTNRH